MCWGFSLGTKGQGTKYKGLRSRCFVPISSKYVPVSSVWGTYKNPTYLHRLVGGTLFINSKIIMKKTNPPTFTGEWALTNKLRNKCLTLYNLNQ